jgi:hypothetical protein
MGLMAVRALAAFELCDAMALSCGDVEAQEYITQFTIFA